MTNETEPLRALGFPDWAIDDLRELAVSKETPADTLRHLALTALQRRRHRRIAEPVTAVTAGEEERLRCITGMGSKTRSRSKSIQR